MKKQSFQAIGLTVVAAITLAACSGLGKLVKNADQITYTVSPEVLGVHGDSIMFTINGSYPAKTFPKKATVTTTPVLVYEGGEQSFDPVMLIGEQVQGKGTTITYAEGGKFSYTSNKIGYEPGMKVGKLELRAVGELKSKKKDLPAVKVADATITTPLLVKSDDKVLIGKDKFQKTVGKTVHADLMFLIDEAIVRTSELKGEQMTALRDFIIEHYHKGSIFKGISISAYASPDGELDVNTELADDRAKTTVKALKSIFNDKKSGVKVEAALEDSFYNIVTTAEDWDGFKAAMEASSIADKDLILRVLTMYPDGETREKEIKNLSETYVEIRENILPKLRRSVITLEVEEKNLEDDQISNLADTDPEKLGIEELLYSATLTDDVNKKLEIYSNASRIYPEDWRTFNNKGYAHLLLNELEAAEEALRKAEELNDDAAAVRNNLGVIERRKGNRTVAMELFSTATEAGFAPSYNMGIVEIQNGNYAAAVTSFGDNNSFNASLAKLLAGTPDDAIAALDNSDEKEDALSYYLRAVIGARKNSNEDVVTNLKIAIEKDASFKEMAQTDAEFLKFKDNADYKAVVE